MLKWWYVINTADAHMVIEESRENCICSQTVKGKKTKKTVGMNSVFIKSFLKV